MAAYNIPLNDYFELGNREVPLNEFEDVFYDITHEEDEHDIDVINMLMGTIYYGNYNSCEYILNNYNFSQMIYNENFIDLLRQTLYQLQDLIDDDDQYAINTQELVYDNFQYLQNRNNIRREYFRENSSDIESETESDSSEIIAVGYDSF